MAKCGICGGTNTAGIGAAMKMGIESEAVLCRDCGALLLRKNPSGKAIWDFFSAGKSREGGRREQFLNNIYNYKRAQSQLLFLSESLPPSLSGLRVLEIGCRYGFLARMYRELGCGVACVEPDADCMDYLRGVGIEAYADLKQAKSAGFDLVLMSHVLHTLPDPLAYLKNMSRLMKKGGLLFVETNNTESAFVRGQFLKNEEALNSLSEVSLGIALKKAGLDVLRVSCVNPAYYGKGRLGVAIRRFYDRLFPRAAYLSEAPGKEAIWMRAIAQK